MTAAREGVTLFFTNQNIAAILAALAGLITAISGLILALRANRRAGRLEDSYLHWLESRVRQDDSQRPRDP